MSLTGVLLRIGGDVAAGGDGGGGEAVRITRPVCRLTHKTKCQGDKNITDSHRNHTRVNTVTSVGFCMTSTHRHTHPIYRLCWKKRPDV